MTRGAGIVVLAAVAAAAGAAAAAPAPPLIADLSSREIDITTGFSGTELLLFGTTDGTGDVVIVVRGPPGREVVRRKTRIAGIWVNGRSVTFKRVPGYYRVASSRPLSALAPPEVLERFAIGLARLPITPAAPVPAALAERFRAGLVEGKQRRRLYSAAPGQVTFVGGRLFRTSVAFPASVPTGTYSVEVYLFRGGRAETVSKTLLTVRKAGIEADIFNFAHQRAALHGLIAILIALVSGWLAGLIFKKG